MQSTSSISSLIWSTADDDLRGLFKPSEYGRVILPFVVMRRLDCVLESKKDEVYNLYQKLVCEEFLMFITYWQKGTNIYSINS